VNGGKAEVNGKGEPHAGYVRFFTKRKGRPGSRIKETDGFLQQRGSTSVRLLAMPSALAPPLELALLPLVAAEARVRPLTPSPMMLDRFV